MNIKLICSGLLVLLTGCADLSMYNQVPAPVGGTAQSSNYPAQREPAKVETYALDDAEHTDYIAQPEAVVATNSPAIVALLDGAHQYREQGQYDMAAVKLERAVRISPRNPQVWHELANIRMAQQQYEMAISLAKKSNLLAAGNRVLQRNNWLLIADSFSYLGQASAANKAKRKAASLF